MGRASVATVCQLVAYRKWAFPLGIRAVSRRPQAWRHRAARGSKLLRFVPGLLYAATKPHLRMRKPAELAMAASARNDVSRIVAQNDWS
eukprot:6176941-Pleurochrysis_carterae.AAC.3